MAAVQDPGGRLSQLHSAGNIRENVSLYLPSGSSGDIRQEQKYKFMNFYENILAPGSQIFTFVSPDRGFERYWLQS